MIIVKITADNGLTWTTPVSCSFEEAKAYFSNAIFVNANGDGVETRHKCVSIKQVA